MLKGVDNPYVTCVISLWPFLERVCRVGDASPPSHLFHYPSIDEPRNQILPISILVQIKFLNSGFSIP